MKRSEVFDKGRLTSMWYQFFRHYYPTFSAKINAMSEIHQALMVGTLRTDLFSRTANADNELWKLEFIDLRFAEFEK